MTIEQEFQRVVLERISEAKRITGYSFSGLLNLISELGPETAARRLIANSEGEFQKGMLVLFKAGLLHLSVEQAVIEFGERGEIFTIDEVEMAKERLQTITLLLTSKRDSY